MKSNMEKTIMKKTVSIYYIENIETNIDKNANYINVSK